MEKNPTKHYIKEKNPTKHYIEGKEPHQTLHRRKRTPPNITHKGFSRRLVKY
jgi:hypothetical protein